MHTSTIASNRAALGTCLLSTLVLSPLSAQESSRLYASGERARSARVERRHTGSDTYLIPSGDPDSLPARPPGQPDASAPTQCGADLGIADASVVIEELPEPAYIHTLSKSEISSLENESSGRLSEAVGLTLVLAGAVETKMGEAQTQSGASCAIVEGVRILPMKEVTVYVAREYTLGSCNYNAVKRHEDEHVAIARRLVTEYRPRLLRAVTELHPQSHEFATQAIGESASTRKIASEVQSAVQGVIDELKQAMRDANRLLDQRDTGKTLRKCSSW